MSGKNGNLTDVSGVLENEHVLGFQTQGPVLFTLHIQVLGNENDAEFLMERTFNKKILAEVDHL